MIVHEVAKKYARALFMSADQRNLIDTAYEQFGSLQQLVKTDRSLITFLASPNVESTQKLKLVRAVFTDRMDRLFVEFLVVLVQKRRVEYLAEVIDEFNRMVEYRKGITRATVITAVPLTESEESAVAARLSAKTNQQVQLEMKVDPDIMGGVIVLLHDEIIDGSVQHGLRMLREQLSKVKVA